MECGYPCFTNVHTSLAPINNFVLLLFAVTFGRISVSIPLCFMSFKGLIVFAILLVNGAAFAQCSPPDFAIDPAVCSGQRLLIQNVSAGLKNVEWDFCDGSINNPPFGAVIGSLTKANSPDDIALFKEDNKLYGFIASLGNGALLRVEFSDQLQSFSQETSLGSFGGTLTAPKGIALLEDHGERYALLTSNGPEGVWLTRLQFGNSYFNTPSPSIINLPGIIDARQLELVNDDGNIYAVLASGGSTAPKITVVGFGSSMANNPVITSHTLPGDFLVGVSIVKDCGDWFVFTEGYFSGIHRLAFGNSLSNTPSIQKLTPVTPVSLPLNISIVKSAGNYYGLVAVDASPDKLLKLDFGPSLTNLSPTVSEVGDFGQFDLPIGAELFKSGSKYYWVAMNFTNNKVAVIDFPKDCDVYDDYNGQNNPLPTYHTPGTFVISLTATDASGNVSSKSQSITVTTDEAPDILIASENVCENHDVYFTSANTSGDILSYSWDFGDGETSSDANPVHQFSETGSFATQLDIAGANGCMNHASADLKIYPEPTADFIMPPDPICTNGQVMFANNTTDEYDGRLAYEWSINDALVGNGRDLAYVFESTGQEDIRLKMSIPGCSTEITKGTNVKKGPSIEIAAEGNCELNATHFTSVISEPVISYVWNFGDGSNAAEPNPDHTYNAANSYDYSVLVLSESGCSTLFSDNIIVNPKPVSAFDVEAREVYCTGTTISFDDKSTIASGAITRWKWDFGEPDDENYEKQNPSHSFLKPQNYEISLHQVNTTFCSQPKL
jgi:PKD repeat protein